jgi:hypothetical protein
LRVANSKVGKSGKLRWKVQETTRNENKFSVAILSDCPLEVQSYTKMWNNKIHKEEELKRKRKKKKENMKLCRDGGGRGNFVESYDDADDKGTK